MIVIVILFVIIGILVKYGKMYFLIAGFNAMSKKEKKTVDIERLASLVRNVMFGMALLITIGIIVADLTKKPSILAYSLPIALAIGIPYLLIASNTRKYKNIK